jgi:hypothetical protein
VTTFAAAALSHGDSIFQAKAAETDDFAKAMRELRERVPRAPRVGFEANININPAGKYAWHADIWHVSPLTGAIYISEFHLISKVRGARMLGTEPATFDPPDFQDGVVDQNGDVQLRDGQTIFRCAFERDPRFKPQMTSTERSIVRAVRSYLKLPGGVLPIGESDRQIEVLAQVTIAALSAAITPILGHTYSDEAIRGALIAAGLRRPLPRKPAVGKKVRPEVP